MTPKTATRPTDHTPSALQLEVVRALHRRGVTLRWHSYITGADKVRGRGQLQGTPVMADRLLPSYTVRQLVRMGVIEPATDVDGKPFVAGGAPFRDFAISAKGRALVAHYGEQV